MAELIWNGSEKEVILSGVEQDIYSYILNNKDECYDDVLADDDRWKVFYHLSEMRTSILNWYDFGENASILEIGGGFGAITGMLCRRAGSITVVEKSYRKAEALKIRYRNRDNLRVYAGEIENIEFSHPFDYVVITGASCDGANGVPPEEQLEQYVNFASKWLKNSGILLLTLDNCNGAKYQCGYPRPIAGSINENGAEAMLGREQLGRIAENAGFAYIKFYYPFPDYRLTQEIYTDARLPEGSIKDRILTYCVLPGMLYEDEYKLYSNEIEKGDIRDICNSYLLECSRSELNSGVDYVAVSTDRGKEHGFFTTIDKDQVKKSSIYENGKKYLRKSYDNILEIQQSGVKIVPHTYQNDKLVMPIVRSPKLIDFLKDLALESREKFVQAIDKVYECIVKSSGNIEKDGKIYLEKGYIDMIPLNCFAEKGDYYFFDQEFCELECPLDYVMFRVLRYTYLTYPELETYVRLEDMKERYGLQNSWQDYLIREDKFIWKNRQHRVNHSFYRWIENGKINTPIVYQRDICGLYLAEDFDVLEKNENDCWAWAVGEHAGIFVRNYTKKEIKVRIKFSLCPPPGRWEQDVMISKKNEIVSRIKAPAVIEYEETVLPDAVQYLRFYTTDKFSQCDNGDPRKFAFQLLNPQLIQM